MIRQSLLLGSGAAIYLAHPVRDLECVQCLKIGPGPLIHVAASPASGDAIRIRLRESTCRNSGAIVRWLPGRKEKSRGDVLVEANDCVFDLLPNRAALFEIATAIPDRDWHARVTVTGEGSLAGDSPIVGARIDPETGRLLPLDAEELSVEGLVGGPFTFVGEAGNNPASSEILSYDAPRRSTVPPGMRAEYLPTITETGARYRAAAESL
jgi:hypothetical protein